MLASFLGPTQLSTFAFFFVLQATRKLGGAWEQGNLNTTLPATSLYEQTRNFPKQLCCSEWFLTCSQINYCTAHLRTISDTALVMYLGPALWRLFTTQRLYLRQWPLCLHQTHQQSGDQVSGIVRKSLRYAVLQFRDLLETQVLIPGDKTSTYQLIHEPFLVEQTA